jgi:DNA polymerase
MYYIKTNIIGLDFETYSAAPLPSVGLANYVADPTFRPTLAGTATAWGTKDYDFITDPDAAEKLKDTICVPDVMLVAHNAGFERAVLRHMGLPDLKVYDSAVVAAVAGANRHLRGAAEQLLGLAKLDEDGKLLRLFAMPQQDQHDLEFDVSLVEKHPDEWADFKTYCMRDADLSRRLFIDWNLGDEDGLFKQEMQYADLTLRMNEQGWPIDVASTVQMRERYIANLDRLMDKFADEVDPDLNLFSTPQLKEWCEKRGIKSNSFDKDNVERMIRRMEKRPHLDTRQLEVLRMLRTKQELGGTSPKKLETILLTQHNGRLYDQYVHAGAGQSLRTSGRSVQMQNLPRLEYKRDLRALGYPDAEWSNEQLAGNLRQLFCATDPDGRLIVADFSAIESRALGFLAGEQWKVDAYTQGLDVYKKQAMAIYHIPDYDAVTPDERRLGKVAELSCGYGAGATVVQETAAKSGVELSEVEAKMLVRDWRNANPKIVEFWSLLDEGLQQTLASGGNWEHTLPNGIIVQFQRKWTPYSLQQQDLKAQTIVVSLIRADDGLVILRRLFHGCHMNGGDVGYYKPSALKTGKPWARSFTNPKTKLRQRYKLWGGKLAGVLTQSLCREVFFDCLNRLDEELEGIPNAHIVGQFHDEVIVEWSPSSAAGAVDWVRASALIRQEMSVNGLVPDLPMAVEVKHDRRYTK